MTRTRRPLEAVWHDARHAARIFRREPLFAAAATLTLALGVATTTTFFSVADAELWKPLPFPDPERLVAVPVRRPGTSGVNVQISGADFLDWQAETHAFERLAAMASTSRRVMLGTTPESVSVTPVTVDFLRTFGVAPSHGRDFTDEDAGGGAALIVTERGWRRLFGADPGVVGRTLSIDGRPSVVVGIVPDASLAFLSRGDFYVAIDTGAAGFRDRGAPSVSVIGRLREGVAMIAAEAELRTIAERIALAHPEGRTGHSVGLTPLREYSLGHNWRPLYFFLGASALVLILSCVNVANLMLARHLRRRRELAIRTALGATRRVLARQFVIESGILAAPGGVLGVILAWWALRLLSTQLPDDVLARGGAVPVDLRVWLFAAAVTGLTAIAVGVAPLLLGAERAPARALGEGGRHAASAGQTWGRRSLLVAEVALTVVLLAGAGVFLKSFAALTTAPLGFEPRDRVAARVVLSGPRYENDDQRRAYVNDLLSRIDGLPGVRDAAAGSSTPLNSGPVVNFVVPGAERPALGNEPRALVRAVTPGFFRALGIDVIRGREFTAADGPGAPRVAIVNQQLARQAFGDGDPIGAALELVPGARTPWTRRPGRLMVVGVTRNIKDVFINEINFNNLYVPFAQMPAPGVELVVTAAIPATATIAAVRSAAAQIDPALPVTGAVALEQRVTNVLQGDRFNLLLVVSFAAAALVLSAVGIYGLMAYTLGARTREFGIRIALGALPGTIRGSALREALALGLVGGVAGLGATIGLARVLGNALYLVPGEHNGLLFNVRTTDPAALSAAVLGIVAVAGLAGIIPAHRATKVDPLMVLRQD